MPVADGALRVDEIRTRDLCRDR